MPFGNFAFDHFADMYKQALATLFRIADFDTPTFEAHFTPVALLPAGFAIKWSLVDDQRDFVTGFG